MEHQVHGSRLFFLDFFLVIVSLLTYLIDVFVGSLYSYKHFREADYLLGAIHALAMLLSGLVTSGMCCLRHETDYVILKLPTSLRIFRVLAIVFLISPISGYVNVLYLLLIRHRALKKGELGTVQRNWEKTVLYLEEVAVFRLFQSFIHAAPQLVVQLYVIVQQARAYRSVGWQDLLGLTSLISLSTAMVTYDRSSRQKSATEDLRFPSILLLFLSYLFSIGARLLVIALFASLSIQYTCLALAIHWLVMLSWTFLPLFNSPWCCRMEKLFGCVALATAYVTVFVNPHKDSRTRNKYFFYFAISLLGNTTMMTMWYRHGDYLIPWLYYSGMIGHYSFFVIGIVLLVIYYAACHPKSERLQLDDVPLNAIRET